MTSGPVLALVLRKPNAVPEWRALIGPTNSEKARAEKPDSLRAKYGTDGQRNAFHGSDSAASAQREALLIFPGLKL
jgi:nucleoside-diphosphate kinase